MVVFSEKFLEIIYQMVLVQNRRLLREIAVREKIPVQDLYRTFLKGRKEFRQFMHLHPPPCPHRHVHPDN